MRHAKRWGVLVALLLVVPVACSDSKDDSAKPGGTSVGSGALEATIRRTTDGVPHIVASSLDGAIFGQGYASGEDRSCDLADQVVKIKGERSKWLGAGDADANINSDFSWKSLGLYERASTEYPGKAPAIRAMVDNFAAGWNKYLSDVGGATGIKGWCQGADWVQPVTGLDVYAYARAVGVQASSGQLLGYIADAEPPAATPVGTQAAPAAAGTTSGPVATPIGIDTSQLGSNGWAIGADRTESGGGMLLANPHFPWEQELRFWEVQLTVPGQIDIYGVQLSGLPGVGIGFTDSFAWTHTVSAGNRFTAYTLDLVPGKPTTYTYDGAEREMTKKDIPIEVKGADTLTRTAWSSQYGPIISFPGVGWSDTMTITYRDANIDNDAFLDQYLAMDTAKNLDEFIDAHKKYQGVPLFNTIAVSKDGRAWYADTSATPDLSPDAIKAYDDSLTTNVIAKTAAGSGAVVLDGSNSLFEWQDEPGARSPGLVPYDKMPKVERSDYVFNANDSFWIPNADNPLTGDYSPLHGRQDTVRSLRTRQNAAVLRDAKFNIESLTTTALNNVGYTASQLRASVVERCQATPTAVVDGTTVDLRAACAVLGAWDGTYNLEASGAALWREFLGRFDSSSFGPTGDLWAVPFDAARPVDTPSGLAPAPTSGPDPVLVHLAEAVQLMGTAGKALDTPLGQMQSADRNGEMVPVHGGNSLDGVTNVVGYSGKPGSTLEPIPTRGDTVAKGTALTADGYRINNGSSFMLAIDFGGGTLKAKVLLNYGDSQDRSNPVFVSSTKAFSTKSWRDVQLGEDWVKASPGVTEKTVSAA